jgi:hypothetical protein
MIHSYPLHETQGLLLRSSIPRNRQGTTGGILASKIILE